MKNFSIKAFGLMAITASAFFADFAFAQIIPQRYEGQQYEQRVSRGRKRMAYQDKARRAQVMAKQRKHTITTGRRFKGPILDKRYLTSGHYSQYWCPGCKVYHNMGYKCPHARRTSYCRIHSKYHKIWSRCPN